MTTDLETRLAGIEALLDDMSDLLVRGDAIAFETSAAALRQSMAELASATGRGPVPALQQPEARERLQRVSQALVRQRDNVARRAVIAERGLAAVLPQHSATYAPPGRTAPFGSARAYATPAV